MPDAARRGLPVPRGPLAPTPFRAPAATERLTIVPDLPLVPVRAVVASALADEARDVLWIEPSVDDAWDVIRSALAPDAPADLSADELADLLAEKEAARLLVLAIPAGLPVDVDAHLLALLRGTRRLAILAISPARRPLEVLGRAEFAATVVHAAELVVDAEGIRSFSARLGFSLDGDQAAALAASPLALPDVLPAVVASASLEEIETQGDPVAYLLDECETYLTMRFRARATTTCSTSCRSRCRRRSRPKCSGSSPGPRGAHPPRPDGAGRPRLARAGGRGAALPLRADAAASARARTALPRPGPRAPPLDGARPLLRRPGRSARRDVALRRRRRLGCGARGARRRHVPPPRRRPGAMCTTRSSRSRPPSAAPTRASRCASRSGGSRARGRPGPTSPLRGARPGSSVASPANSPRGIDCTCCSSAPSWPA